MRSWSANRARTVVLARIGPASYERLSQTAFLSGDTSITGKVERVGGATEMRCALRVSFQSRMLFCRVATPEVARKLGECLYKNVAVTGQALWLKDSWRIVAFKITGVVALHQGAVLEAMEALREAGGKAWDDVDAPESFLAEVCGK